MLSKYFRLFLDRHNVMPVSWSYPRHLGPYFLWKKTFTSFLVLCLLSSFLSLISSFDFEFRFRVSISSFYLEFRVSSSSFEFEFRVRVSSFEFEFEFRVQVSSSISSFKFELNPISNMSVASPSDNRISLSYSMPDFSTNSFVLFINWSGLINTWNGVFEFLCASVPL